jgi:hypothetical protein
MPHDSSPTADDTDAVPKNASGIEKGDIALGATLASERDHPLVKAAGEADKLGDQAPLYALSGAVLIAGIVFAESTPSRQWRLHARSDRCG